MSSSPSPTFRKAYEAINEEFKNSFDSLRGRAIQFKEKLDLVSNKLDGFFRSKCGDYIGWLESNTVNTNGTPVLKDKSKSAEFESTIKNLQNCVEHNDNGYTQVLINIDNSMHEISERANAGFQQCSNLSQEGEIKDCLRKILKENLGEVDQFYNNFQDKLEEVNRKL